MHARTHTHTHTHVHTAQVSLVAGPYMYYHYMQDKFDDKGWGCAYRSLQTLHSWFRLNQYTDVPVPTHREIQQVRPSPVVFLVCLDTSYDDLSC